MKGNRFICVIVLNDIGPIIKKNKVNRICVFIDIIEMMREGPVGVGIHYITIIDTIKD